MGFTGWCPRPLIRRMHVIDRRAAAEGRRIVVDTVRETVEGWRAGQQTRLEQGGATSRAG
jgi:hypothetical protein